jgi:hypothetical protein
MIIAQNKQHIVHTHTPPHFPSRPVPSHLISPLTHRPKQLLVFIPCQSTQTDLHTPPLPSLPSRLISSRLIQPSDLTKTRVRHHPAAPSLLLTHLVTDCCRWWWFSRPRFNLTDNRWWRPRLLNNRQMPGCWIERARRRCGLEI